MFQAVHAWEQAGGSPAFIRDVFYPAACAIVDAHLRGTHHGIHVDPRDGLLVGGGPGTNLTWMDARVNDVPVTPRHGKPVEVNALWYNALRLSERWARQLGDGPRTRSFGREADLVAGAFDRAFWNDARRCCFDVILPEGPDARLRPNQLFAVGLPFPLLDGRRRAMVLETVEAALVTPGWACAPWPGATPATVPPTAADPRSATRPTTRGWCGPGWWAHTWTRCSRCGATRRRPGPGAARPSAR
jgi:predicted glycogen debranching enzyme